MEFDDSKLKTALPFLHVEKDCFLDSYGTRMNKAVMTMQRKRLFFIPASPFLSFRCPFLSF